ncbi:F0F1 ATP synthase subunit A [Phytohabitans houttuyneae]|uniref:ATP synthase subunit a n=1 Tax=Phytohabitans houttuyneae TaxID=1076126 RepID=A0A6V8KP34_9ACTN|nr:F0F1 ATP synthase subunit A [Phytohabitans houttuyneae]GFJ85160.1 ATP synthase subunit a [Phytohabitans houttuyneae]
MSSSIAAEIPWPPSVEDFFLPPIVEGADPWFTKVTVLVWVAVAALIIFFLVTYRDPKIVPTKRQWIAESIYGFVRNSVAKDLIGHEGVRFAPYLTTLFCFVLLTNLFGIIPGIQMSPNSHIAFPAILAIISWVLFNVVGIRQHGFAKYMRNSLIPPAPWFILPLLIPIEFVSTFIFRPFTLAVRLFANMFAGHMILLVFTLGGFVMLNSNAWLAPVSLLSWLMAIALTFLEAMVIVLQAYVFTVLTASYIQGALAEEH